MKYEHLAYSPFSGNTILEIGEDQSIFQDKGDKKHFVRNNTVVLIKDGSIVRDMKRCREYAGIAEGEFRLLEELGVGVVGHDSVFFNSASQDKKGIPKLVTISDFVEGGSMLDAPSAEIESTMNGLLAYFKRKFINRNEPCLGDIASDFQYMYGKSGNNSIPRIYLVDLDFALTENWIYGNEVSDYFILNQMYKLKESIRNAEIAGKDIQRTQSLFWGFVETINPDALSESGQSFFFESF